MKHIAFTLILFAAAPTGASVKTLKPVGGGDDVLAIGKPTFIKIHGKGTAPSGELIVEGQTVKGVLEFDLQSLDTGMPLRNQHMHETYLKTKANPKAKLELKPVTLKPSWSEAAPAVPKQAFEGILTLNGIAQPVTGTFEVSQERKVDAEFTIQLSAFKIDVPKYLGVTVADEVKINVKIADLKASP